MKDPRKELFILDGAVYVPTAAAIEIGLISLQYRRPGILVLINDSDWELEGEDKYELANNDNILFVSTLHGG